MPLNENATLDFSRAWSGDGQLEFTAGDAPPAPLIIDVTAYDYLYAPRSTSQLTLTLLSLGTDTFSGLSAASLLSAISPGIAAGTLTSPADSSTDLGFDINVDRGPKSDTASKHQDTLKVNHHSAVIFSDSPRLSRSNIAAIVAGERLQNRISTVRLDMDRLINQQNVTIIDGQHVQRSVYHLRKRVLNALLGVIAPFDEADHRQQQVISAYKFPPKKQAYKPTHWQDTNPLFHQLDSDFNDGLAIHRDLRDKLSDGHNPTGTRIEEEVPPPVEVIAPEPELDFKTLWEHSGNLDFYRIELDALIVMNEINVYHVASDGTKTAIHPVNATLDFDIDSQVWSFKGQLLGTNSLSWLTYRASFEINVNGHQLLFTLREYERARSFASDAYTFTAVTNTQWLFSPYAELYSGAVDNPTGAWQIVESILTEENFSLIRSDLTPEWVLAADSFSYLNKTPIEMAIQTAEACGAILQPDKTDNILYVQPRYKISPWNWSALADDDCDHVINADYVITESSSDNTTIEINRVLISGETHGVITDAYKSGTAGDVRGTDVLSNLSQDHSVNRELARNIMGDSGAQEVMGLSVPLLTPDSGFGLLLPGQIIRVVYADKTITGLCLSNSIPIQSLTDVSQSVKLELNNGYS